MRLKTTLSVCLALTVSSFSQSRQSIDVPGARLSLGSPSFTDRSQYNSYDFCNSPLGILKTDSSKVTVNVGFRNDSWHGAGNSDTLQKSYSAWNLPNIIIAKPKIAYLRLYYTPTSISETNYTPGGSVQTEKLSVPMQRFGLTLAGQVPSGILQLALQGKGYYGQETSDVSANTRLIMGLEDLSATIGSKIHELVTIGMQGSATAKLDTLRAPLVNDRYFVGQIPVLGWYIDFGKDGFPIASDLSVHIATHHFVYVNELNVKKDPIQGDSLAWQWQSIGDFHQGGITYNPALHVGYWSNHYQLFQPTETNDNLNVGLELPGSDWKVSDMSFGFGSSVTIKEYVKTWFEYTHSELGLDYGEAWHVADSKKSGYDRIALGVETRVHAIQALNIPKSTEVFFRLGYFNQRENSTIGAFQADEFGLINTMSPNSLNYRYTPDFGWGQDQRVIGFTVGAGASFFNKMLEVSSHIGFLSLKSNSDYSGTAFGFDLTYNLM